MNSLLPTRISEEPFFAISELDATSLYVIRRHRDLKHIYGDAPVANDSAARYFQKQMRSVDRALEDGRDFILGATFTAADLILSTCLSWADRYDVPVSEPARVYNARVMARPAYAKALESNRPPGNRV